MFDKAVFPHFCKQIVVCEGVGTRGRGVRYIFILNLGAGPLVLFCAILLLSARKHLDYRSPFPESEIEEVKFKVKQRSKMHKAISEFIVTVFLLILLCSIAYSQRDPHGFLLRTNLENQLFRPIRPVYKPGVPTTPSITTDTVSVSGVISYIFLSLVLLFCLFSIGVFYVFVLLLLLVLGF